MFNAAEDLQEHILRGVSRVGAVGYDPIHQAVDRLLKFSDQALEGFIRTGFQLFDNRGFVRPNSDRTRKVTQGGCSRHSLHGVTPIIGLFRPTHAPMYWPDIGRVSKLDPAATGIVPRLK